MIPLPFANKQDERKALKGHPLIVTAEFGSPYDLIASINFGDEADQFVEPVPSLYYAVRKGPEAVYLIYAIYHRRDPASLHRHDFEGVLAEIRNGLIRRTATISHLNILFRLATTVRYLEAICESGGHGLSINFEPWLLHGRTAIDYQNWQLVNMGAKPFLKAWPKIQEQFGPNVNLPDRWVDVKLENYVRQKRPTILGERLTTTRGLFWERPDILFELANRRGMIKP